MIKKIAWETFKNTGDINAFMELKQIEDIEKGIEGDSVKSVKEGLEDDLSTQEGIRFEMANVKINGIVLAENNMGDFDKMLTVLTPNVRQNLMCSQRSKKTEKCSFGWDTDVLLWRIFSL